ncbi:ctr copper transporter family protein [Cystoisospora suis]|uniref:Ctr copper transporter family protein n=1 Tax=Cystoisospora suis TaxID=483139 RepID=A0A2C6L281_9APIC|nr:ctr copper transporter family protein [Cystoisospora suis]
MEKIFHVESLKRREAGKPAGASRVILPSAMSLCSSGRPLQKTSSCTINRPRGAVHAADPSTVSHRRRQVVTSSESNSFSSSSHPLSAFSSSTCPSSSLLPCTSHQSVKATPSPFSARLSSFSVLRRSFQKTVNRLAVFSFVVVPISAVLFLLSPSTTHIFPPSANSFLFCPEYSHTFSLLSLQVAQALENSQDDNNGLPSSPASNNQKEENTKEAPGVHTPQTDGGHPLSASPGGAEPVDAQVSKEEKEMPPKKKPCCGKKKKEEQQASSSPERLDEQEKETISKSETTQEKKKPCCKKKQMMAASSGLENGEKTFQEGQLKASHHHSPTEGSTSSCCGVMPMYFQNTYHTIILFKGFETLTSWQYALSILLCIFLGMFSVVLKVLRLRREFYFSSSFAQGEKTSTKHQASSLSSDESLGARAGNEVPPKASLEGFDRRSLQTNFPPGEEKKKNKTMMMRWFVCFKGGFMCMRGFPLKQNFCRMIEAFILYGYDYLLMLIVMTFNVGLFFAVTGGLALGFFFFGHLLRIKAEEGNDEIRGEEGHEETRQEGSGYRGKRNNKTMIEDYRADPCCCGV